MNKIVEIILGRRAPKGIYELSKRSKLTILLDENIDGLQTALRSAGYLVRMLPKRTPDDAIKADAEGCVILTQNTKDFIKDANRFDYDLIDIKHIKFVDNAPEHKKNTTVQKIDGAIRESQLGTRKGTYCLHINDNGSFRLEQLF